MYEVEQCYDREQYNYGRCVIRTGSHKIIGERSSDPDKCITVLLPLECIPKGDDTKSVAEEKYAEAIKFFRKLKEETCICYLVLDQETSELYPAIMAGWEKKDIILRILSIENPKRIMATSDEVDLYMREVAGHQVQQNFRAIYMDEPHLQYNYMRWYDYFNPFKKFDPFVPHKFSKFRSFVNKVLKTKFIITEYIYFDDFPIIGVDFRRVFRDLCDEIIDDGYHDDFWELEDSVRNLGSRTLCFNMKKKSGLDNLNININIFDLNTYFRWANMLGVTDVWLYFGNYKNCNAFWADLELACRAAAKSDWAIPREVFVEEGKRYCKYSDCSKCLGHTYLEDDYWQDEPIGPPCPPTKRGGRIETETQNISEFIYSLYSF